MNFDFDTLIPRQKTGCIKYDRKPDLDPYWVADMDFASAPVILESLHRRVDHGVFGYAQAHQGLMEAIAFYMQNRRGVKLVNQHLVHLGGLVPALSLAARAFCKPGEQVMTCGPVYPPFLSVHKDAEAGLIAVDHVFAKGQWELDWAKMEQQVSETTKIFLLCNPQNPLGRVFKVDEVLKLAEFCLKHDLILVSDEIHCDLIFDEKITPHFSALQLPEELRQRSITLLSPSKTWNIAGLGYAFAIIPDDSIRRRFEAAKGHTLAEINALSYYAAEAAYREGEAWRRELISYLKTNRDELVSFINEECEGLSIHAPEATYLAWIDARALSARVGNPAEFFEKEAGLFLSDGTFFGWPGWVRFNFACPRAKMHSGLQKIKAALARA